MSKENLVYDDIWGGKDVKINVSPNRKMAKEFIKENKGYISGAALLLPITLSACSSSPSEKIDISISVSQAWGIASGVGMAVEEIAEKNPNKNFGRKVIGVITKGAAGYCAGEAISQNVMDGNWSSGNNLSETIILIPAAYVIARESSFVQFKQGVKGIFSGISSGLGRIREDSKIRSDEHINRMVEKALKETVNINKAASGLLETGMDRNEAAQLLINRGWSEKDVKKTLNIK